MYPVGSVKASYPHELANVTARQKDVNSLWDKVREKALQRRARLEDAVGTQIFINQAQNLVSGLRTGDVMFDSQFGVCLLVPCVNISLLLD